MVAEMYVEQQPQKVQTIIPLIDSSVGWVDARNLVIHALVRHYCRYFEAEYAALLEMAMRESVWRKLIPLGVAGQIIKQDASCTGMALALLPPVFDSAKDENVLRGITYVLRSASLYGNQHSVATFITSHQDQLPTEINRTLCDCIRMTKSVWDADFREAILPVLRKWQNGTGAPPAAHVELAIARLSAA